MHLLLRALSKAEDLCIKMAAGGLFESRVLVYYVLRNILSEWIICFSTKMRIYARNTSRGALK